MELTNKITENKLFRKCLKKNKKYEKGRKFCRHGIEHLLDTARVAYILDLERSLNIEKDIIYAAALLHDCGRWKQYKSGIPHEIASSAIAKVILEECECDEDTEKLILTAISEHRNDKSSCNLSRIIYEADKSSRMCLFCKAESECNWNKSRKNMFIKY